MSESCLLLQRYRDGLLVDAFTLTPDSGDARALFDHIGRLPCLTSDLVDGALVIDLQEGMNLNEDPLTVQPDYAEWLLFEFLKMGKRTHSRLVAQWRNDHAAPPTPTADTTGGEGS